MFPTLPTSVNHSNCFFLPIVMWDQIIHNSHSWQSSAISTWQYPRESLLTRKETTQKPRIFKLEMTNLTLKEPCCTLASVSWASYLGCPDFLPKTPIYTSTFEPKNYICKGEVLPYSLFAPRNLHTLHNIAFNNALRVLERKNYYLVPAFYCKDLHMWFYSPFNTGIYLAFSKITRALVKVITPMEVWLFNEGGAPVGIQKREECW